MTQQQYIINRKLNIMELGQTLGNISDACRKLGVSRQHYYDIKQAIAEKTALTAVDFLNDKVLPFFDEHSISALRMLTYNGSEYCGRQENHAYALFLHLNDLEHTRIKVRHPQTNGAVERLNQTIQEGFYKVAFRKKIYRSLPEI